jgi:hypothetical protein
MIIDLGAWMQATRLSSAMQSSFRSSSAGLVATASKMYN